MSDPTHSPLTVVGAGPAGIMAAYTAAEAGVDVTLIDDNPMSGGQYYRQSPREFKFSNPLDGQSGRVDASQILSKLPHPKIHTIYNTQVWGAFEQHLLALADQEHSSLLQADKVILATGAYDRPLAFPGWTLPGIFGAGATLRMIKTQWVLPGKRVLLAGLGPLQLALAYTLLKAGAEVVCVAEAANPYQGWQQLPKFWGHWDRLGEAFTYMNALRQHHTPLLFNHAIVEASGKDQVEIAKIARLDCAGRADPGQRAGIRSGRGLPGLRLTAILPIGLCAGLQAALRRGFMLVCANAQPADGNDPARRLCRRGCHRYQRRKSGGCGRADCRSDGGSPARFRQRSPRWPSAWLRPMPSCAG